MRGPALHVIAAYPADGQGTNAAPDADVDCGSPTPDCPVPTDAAIELRFDRYLLPGDRIAAAHVLPDGRVASGLLLANAGNLADTLRLRVEYDLIERVLVLHPTQPLQPNTLYVAYIPISVDLSAGYWAFDRAPLEAAGSVPLRFSFATGSGPSAKPAPVLPAPDTCETMSQGPLAICAGCHATTPAGDDGAAPAFPAMGLDLSSPRGLYYTAVRHVAHQTETGDRIDVIGEQTPERFGVQMNLVDPGNPATSYLMYKLLQKRENFRLASDEPECELPYHSPVVEAGCSPPDSAESSRLREWFIQGEPMPKNGRSASGAELPTSTDHANLVRISRWIATGATCAEPDARPAP